MSSTGRFLFLYLLFIPLITIVVYWQLKSITLPLASPTQSDNGADLPTFSVERAYDALVALSHEEKGFGEHAFTSKKCQDVQEWLVQYLRDTVDARSSNLNKQDLFEVIVDEQNESGEYAISDSHIMGHQLRRYSNVTNVLAMIRPKSTHPTHAVYPGEAILVNSHFDSRVSSTGAFDDGVPVVVMMELFKNILDQLLTHHHQQSSTAELLDNVVPLLRHPIIFLWNGAEEMGLLGAHAFMNKHPWAKDVKAFINLEAAGFGGGAMLFQTTNAWITKEYAKVIVHPLGNALGQDLFQSGIVPSDTDFRFFSSMKKQVVMHGVDSAFVENGHWYHTNFDSLTKNNYSHSDIKKSIIHMGDNTASLLRHLSFMDGRFPDTSLDSHTRSAYFDILGLLMVAYNAQTAKPVYFGIIIVSITLILAQVLTGKVTFVSLISSLICTMSSIVGGAAFAVATSHLLIHFQRHLSWYALGPEYAFALYALPAMFGTLFTAKFTSVVFTSKYINKSSMYASCMIFWMLFLAATAHYGLGSSFLPAIVVGSLLVGLFFSSVGFLQLVVASILPLIMLISLGFTFTESFSGMLGRSGRKPVDYLMGGLVGLVGTLVASVTLPFVSGDRITKTDNKQKVVSEERFGVSWLLIFVFAVVVGLLISYSYVASPYSQLRPKRLSLRHVILYENGAIKDSYLNLRSTDPIQPEYVFNKMNMSDHGFAYNSTVKSHWISNLESKNLEDAVFYKNVLLETNFDPNMFLTNLAITSENVTDMKKIKYTVSLSNSKFMFNQQVLVRTKDPKIISHFYFADAPYYDKTEGAYTWDIVSGYSRFETEELNANGPKIQSFSFVIERGQEKNIQITVRSHFVDSQIWTDSIHHVLSILPDWTNTVPVVSSELSVQLNE